MATGALEISASAIRLTGRAETGLVELTIACDQIEGIHIGRGANERLNGYATVVIERQNGPRVLVAPCGMQLLHEVADVVASVSQLNPAASERIDLIVPIKPGCEERVRALVAEGPPFDLSRFEQHRVYLGDDDVVFSFVGSAVQQTLQQTLTAPELWRAGLAWRRCIASRPRTAPPGYLPAQGRSLIFSWPPSLPPPGG